MPSSLIVDWTISELGVLREFPMPGSLCIYEVIGGLVMLSWAKVICLEPSAVSCLVSSCI